ncbi:MAG: serine/threonine-protein kinase [Planctomycetota bacterium]|jgi:serine/threonine protein kinase/tetratricopeptide (TPR) repeat protein
MSEWTRVREIFEQVVELAAQERTRALDAACAEDASLRAAVEELLAADAEEDSAAIESRAPIELVEAASTRLKQVGAYKIVRLLGSGGMGTVFEATQQSPKRSVAIKILRSMLVSERARRRFEYEAETLARLHHPNIAQIYEAGTWQDPDSGEDSPFFAMEFVAGAKPLDRFAEDSGLDLAQRLELFIQICAAVQHGHQLGVLHRDLKPGNILVGNDGLPKVIDFGIARSADANQDERSMQTLPGQVMGTLAYMSPEQLSGSSKDIDLRSDVYSLGASLYELITGRPPHERGEESIAQFIQRVSETSPSLPSTTQARLQISAELDWILLKALDAERDRRYASVSEFAADLERFLHDEPVTARAQTTGYLLRKFVRRHRSLVATVAAAIVLLLTSTIIAITGWYEADYNMGIARLEASTQQAVTEYTRRLIARARAKGGGREITMLEMLDQSTDVLDELAQGRADVALSLQTAAANFYLDLMHAEKALPLLEEAIEEMAPRLADRHEDVLTARHSYGIALNRLGRYQESVPYLEEVLADRILVFGMDARAVAETRQVLGLAYDNSGDYAAAIEQLTLAVRFFEKLLESGVDPLTEHMNPAHWLVLSRTSLAGALETTGQYEESERVARAAWTLGLDQLGEDDPATANASKILANALTSLDQLDEAIERYRDVLRFQTRVYGESNRFTIIAMNNLAVALQRAGRLDEALEYLREVWRARKANEDLSVSALSGLFNLASVLEKNGDLEESQTFFAELFLLCEGRIPEDHWLYGQFRKSYGTLLRRLGRYEEAEVEVLAGLEVMENALGKNHPRIVRVIEELVILYQVMERPEAAARYQSRLEASKQESLR